MEMRTCNCCGEELPATLEFFYKEKGGKFGLKSQCKECMKKYNRQWRKDNKERQAEYSKQWHEDNREYILEKMKQWKKDNREKVNAYVAKRRAIQKGATEGENFTRQEVLDEWGTDCHICGEPIDLDEWHQDHVIPLQPEEGESGPHTLGNVKPSHPHCNQSKGNKIYETIRK